MDDPDERQRAAAAERAARKRAAKRLGWVLTADGVEVRTERRVTIGPRTIEGGAAARLAGIAVVAGNTIAVEPQAMIEAADTAGLFVTGLPA